MVRYRIYGYVVETDHPLVSCLDRATGEPDLLFTCSEGGDHPGDYALVYESRLSGFGDEAAFSLYRDGSRFKLHYSGSATFYITHDRIDCHLLDPQYHYWVEIALLGPIMSFWLELRGHIALHASAIVRNGHAIGMMASSKSGKTSLAAAMMRAGASLLTDDILPVMCEGDGIEARPGYPQTRMWPDQAARYIDDASALPLAHPDYDKRRVPVRAIGRFHDEIAPLGAILLPERRSDLAHVQIEPVSRPEALVTLLRGSFAATVVESMPEMQARRLRTVGAIVSRIPVLNLRYPEGYDRIDDVRDEILRTLDTILTTPS